MIVKGFSDENLQDNIYAELVWEGLNRIPDVLRIIVKRCMVDTRDTVSGDRDICNFHQCY